MATHDFKQTQYAIADPRVGVHTIRGFADGSPPSLSWETEDFVLIKGEDGENSHAKQNDTSGSAEFSLNYNSPSIDFLAALARRQRDVVNMDFDFSVHYPGGSSRFCTGCKLIVRTGQEISKDGHNYNFKISWANSFTDLSTVKAIA